MPSAGRATVRAVKASPNYCEPPPPGGLPSRPSCIVRRNRSPHDLRTKLPTVVLIGDDHGDSRDPSAWRCSISAISWARAAIVHGTGAMAWHYAEAVRAAELTGRCLFVETDSDHVAAWLSAIAPRQIRG